jgi:hypothetical protein
MNIWAQLFKTGIRETVDSVGNIVDRLSTTDQEKLNAKTELTKVVTDSLEKITSMQSSMLLAEANGNWLQRSWRPILMLSFGWIIIYSFFIAPAFNLPNTTPPEKFWVLLEIGMGGYVIGRSIEKVADTVTKNVDMPFLKKKNRI